MSKLVAMIGSLVVMVSLVGCADTEDSEDDVQADDVEMAGGKPLARFNPQPDPPGVHAAARTFNPQPDPPGAQAARTFNPQPDPPGAQAARTFNPQPDPPGATE